jgi:hypothetical protein
MNSLSLKLLLTIVLFHAASCKGALSPSGKQRGSSDDYNSQGSAPKGAAAQTPSNFAPQISIPRQQLSAEENKIIDLLSSCIVPLADGLTPVRQGKEVENAIQTAIKAGEQLTRTSDNRRKMRGSSRYSTAGGGSRGSWGRSSGFSGRSPSGYRGSSPSSYRPSSSRGYRPTASSSRPSASQSMSMSRGKRPSSARGATSNTNSSTPSKKATANAKPSKRSSTTDGDDDYAHYKKFIVQALQDITAFISQFTQAVNDELEKIKPSNQSVKLKFEKKNELYATFIQNGKLEQLNEKIKALRAKIDILESSSSRRRSFTVETPKLTPALKTAFTLFLPHAAFLLTYSDNVDPAKVAHQTHFGTALQDPFFQALLEKDALDKVLANVDTETERYYGADVESNIKEFKGNNQEKKLPAEAWLQSAKTIFDSMLQKFPDQEKAPKIKALAQKIEDLNLTKKEIIDRPDILEKE